MTENDLMQKNVGELTDLALSFELVASKTAAKKLRKAGLIEMLSNHYSEKYAEKLPEIEAKYEPRKAEATYVYEPEPEPIKELPAIEMREKRYANGAKDQREHRQAQARRRMKNRIKHQRRLARSTNRRAGRGGWPTARV